MMDLFEQTKDKDAMHVLP